MRVYGMSKVWNLCWVPLLGSCGLLDAGERPRFKFHALRHAAASLFIEQGWSPKKVMTVVGHSTIAMTYDTCGKLFDAAEKDREDVAQIESRLFA
jgi:integrase